MRKIQTNNPGYYISLEVGFYASEKLKDILLLSVNNLNFVSVK